MATRNIHKNQPMAQGKAPKLTLKELRKLPKWQRYLKYGKICDSRGEEERALKWRRRAYRSALDHGEYADAEALASAYLSQRAVGIANALAILRENLSSGRINGEISFLVANAVRAEAPRELIAWELSSTRFTQPELTFQEWRNNPQLSYKLVS